MSETEQALTMLTEQIDSLVTLEEKELLIKKALSTNIFNTSELAKLKGDPAILRHLNLVYLIDKKIEYIEFKEQNEWASNRSPLVILSEVFLQSPLGTKPSNTMKDDQ